MSGDANARDAGPAGGFVRRWKDPDYVDRYVRFTRGVVFEAEVWRRRLEIAPDATLLDLGCCEAKLLVALSPWIRRGVGVDASGAAIARARRNVEKAEATNIELIECDFRQLDLPDESVTTAVSMAALHHVPDDDKSEVLRRVHRCLRAGGLLYLDDGSPLGGVRDRGHGRARPERGHATRAPPPLRGEAPVRARSPHAIRWRRRSTRRSAGFDFLRDRVASLLTFAIYSHTHR